MNRRASLMVIALVLLTAGTASGQHNNTIRGKLRAPNNTTINNAIIELRIGGGGIIQTTVTRNDGDFAFSGLATGEYEIVVTASGYEPTVQIARFNARDRSMNFSEVLNVEVMVRPKPEPAPLGAPGTNFAQDVPKAARSAYDRAVGKMREGKPDEAVPLLREAITAFGDYFDAHFTLGRELFREGKDQEALEEFERAREINDRQDAVYYMFGLVMMKQHKFTVAQRAFREAITLNGSSTASHFYRAKSLIELAINGSDQTQSNSDLAEAEKELDRAWDLSNKRLSAVYLERSRIHERRGEKEAAVRDLEAYLKAEPDSKNAAAIRAAIDQLRGTKK